MKLRRVTVAGFRGFNEPRTMDFDETLTLISAPNSHGKTSITEALEFLFYGQTSKVEDADSKDEYKGSYRNRHFPTTDVAYVEAECVDPSGNTSTFRTELRDDEIARFVDGSPVHNWPFATQLETSARPFVVQHALKSLLLAAPSDRFQGFARLLGLREVDVLQQILVNLCTKPEAQIQPAARQALVELEAFEARLTATKGTAGVAKSLANGSSSLDEAYEKIYERGQALVGKRVAREELSSSLVSLRNAAAEKVFAGSVAIKPLSTIDERRAAAACQRIEGAIGANFRESFARLALGDSTDRLRKRLSILGLGLELLKDEPNQCPLCDQALTADDRTGIAHRHDQLTTSIGPGPDLSTVRAHMTAALKDLRSNIDLHSGLLAEKCADLIAANTPEASQRILALFGKGNEHSLMIVAAAGAAVAPQQLGLRAASSGAIAALDACSDAVLNKAEDIAQVESLVSAVATYLAACKTYEAKLEDVGPTLANPTRLLQAAIDAQAGTTELSLLIELLASTKSISRAVRVKEILGGLKGLKKHVDQAVGQTMEDAFSTELTGAVMNWYKRIRTTGDPDVHFSGFAMERTKAGDFKNRRVKVAAESYGVELASAVSSLSESKLNALGLCMSIATALRAPGPWDFLVLDDPIQSWDNDHEIQFIGIVRALAEEEGKQVILLSHRDDWVDQVGDGCRSLNGKRYHISGYTKNGPVIGAADWAPIDQRLREALAIANDQSSGPVRLQHAEEEIRIAAAQLTSEVSKRKLRRVVGPHNINSVKARAILNEAGCPVALVDRVIATFATTDPAHHAQEGYTANAERVRQYHGTLVELKNWLDTEASAPGG
jgi:energy-coupling factor transporter ATP-binding protein EcfA2